MKLSKIDHIKDLKPGDTVRSTKSGNIYNVREVTEDYAELHHIVFATDTKEWEKLTL